MSDAAVSDATAKDTTVKDATVKAATAKDGAVIELQALTVRYGKSPILDGVSLKVAAGNVYALLGRNGVGKSSLVRCLLGQQKPTSGHARLFGQDSWEHRAKLMERLSVVPEEPDAPPNMTAQQLSRFCARVYPRWDDAGYVARLQRFEVPLKVAFGKLSRGQKAQVMMALALACEPELLVLDDPTLGLDAVARRAVFEELAVELADRGITVFMTSHDLPGVESMATHLALLHGRSLWLDEPLEDLKTRFRRLTFGRRQGVGDRADDGVDLLADLEPLTVRSRGRGVEAIVSKFSEAAFDQLLQHPDVEHLEAHPLSLEDIVVAATDTTAADPADLGAERGTA